MDSAISRFVTNSFTRLPCSLAARQWARLGPYARVTVNTACGAFVAKKPTAKTPSEAKTKAGKKVSPPKAGAAPNALQPSQDLAAIVEAESLPRGEVLGKIWEYIKANNLKRRRTSAILAGDRLRKVSGNDEFTMFKLNKYFTQHLR